MFLNKAYFLVLILFVSLTAIPGTVASQVTIKGKVIYNNDASPAGFVTVGLSNRKGMETMTNFAGNFSLHIANSKINDSMLITAVGYKSIKLPVHIAANRSEFVLEEAVKSLENVVIRKQLVIGSMSESVGYYRSWSYEKTGGEIGRIFSVPNKGFKLDKIRFKAGNLCDTCLVKLHIRDVVDGKPGREILSDSISMYVNHLSLDTKVPEFDLTGYDLTLKQKDFFVGIEVLNCSNGTKGFCSFSFAGTEKGEYLYKNGPAADWQTTDDYTIYLKLLLSN